jgi:hypothetical protein
VAPGVIDQDTAHQFRSGAEEVSAVLPSNAALVDQMKICLVNQSSGFKGVVQTLAAKETGRQAPQLVVHDRQQLVDCCLVTVTPILEQPGDLPFG